MPPCFEDRDGILMYFKSSGFEREGCIREGVWKEGKFVDKIFMGLLAREYRKRQAPSIDAL